MAAYSAVTPGSWAVKVPVLVLYRYLTGGRVAARPGDPVGALPAQGGEGIVEDAKAFAEERLADHHRGQEAEHVPEGPAGQDQQAGLVAGLGHGRRGGWVGLDAAGLHQLDGQHGSAPADIADGRSVLGRLP